MNAIKLEPVLSGYYSFASRTAGIVVSILIIPFCTLSIIQPAIAQEKSKVYKVWLNQIDKGYKITGFLYDINDSTLFVSYDYTKNGYANNQPVFNTIAAADIGFIKLRQRGAVGKRILIGAAVGAVLGGIIGFAQGDDEPNTTLLSLLTDPSFTKEQKAGMGAFIGAQAGVLIGALLGTIKIKIPINGDRNLYKSKLQKLNGYAYK